MARFVQFMRTDGSAFDDDAIRFMGAAFDAACAELQDNKLSDLVREIIAERIIGAAKGGERDPLRLCSIALAAVSGYRKPGEGALVPDLSRFGLERFFYRGSLASINKAVDREG